jgi:hypothetical protein
MIGWSYQQGYCFAAGTARDYAKATGAVAVLHDLGSYGDIIEFIDPGQPIAAWDKPLDPA